MKTGIVGLGYVGSAIKFAESEAETFDINPAVQTTCKTLHELVQKVDVIYVCVPTPMQSDGSCDVSIVESAIDDIIAVAESKKILVIKSTVLPGTTARMQQKYSAHTILFSPEFLTEANFKYDYLNSNLILIGYAAESYKEDAKCLLRHQSMILYRHAMEKDLAREHRQMLTIDATAAEFYKYLRNTFLATKVSFANEMYSIAEQLKIDWRVLTDVLENDPQMGDTHWKVPGPDGHFGFGGTCFPKDLSALINYSEVNGIPTPLLKSVWKRNVLVDRPERDWELLKGRAVN